MDSESHIHSPSVFLYKLLYFQELLSTLLTPPVLVIKHYTHKQKDKEFAFKEKKITAAKLHYSNTLSGMSQIRKTDCILYKN